MDGDDFCKAAGADTRDPANAEAAAAAHELVVAAFAEHPGVAVSRQDLMAHVAAIVGDPAAGVPTLRALCGGDVLVALGAARGDRTALSAFEKMLMKSAGEGLRRLRLDDARRDEVIQRVRITCTLGSSVGGAKLLSYTGRGPLAAWLRVAVVHAAYNMMHERGERRQDTVETDTIVEAVAASDAEMLTMARLYAPHLRQAVAGAIGDLTPKQKTLLRFAIVEGLTVEQIGTIYDTHRATAARHVVKAREALSEGVRKHFRALVDLSDSDFYSVVRALPSWLDFSVERLLKEADAPQTG